MATLDLTVDSVDNAAAYGIDPTATRKAKGICARVWSIVTSNRPLTRITSAGGTDYSEARVAAILRDFLQPDTKLSVQEAAESLLVLIPANASNNAEVCSFGGICVELAEQIPYHHPSQLKLVQLLHYLSRSPKFMYKYTLTENEDCYQAYQLLRESISDSYGGPYVDNPTEWVNLNAFMANLFSTGVWGTSPGKSIETLREVFEKETPEEVWERDSNIMAAAQWILWHGQTLFKLIIYDHGEGETEDEEYWWFGKAFPGPAIKPRSIERWRFWKAGFEAVEKLSNASDECKKNAKKAACVMAALEEGMLF